MNLDAGTHADRVPVVAAAAFFDLDRTLISGASLYPFAVAAWRAGLVSNQEIARWASSALAFKLAGDTGKGRSDQLRTQLLGKVAGVAVSQLDGVAQAMLPTLVDAVRPESSRLVEMHRAANRDTWIVSASPQAIVEALASALAMTGAVGTKGKVVDGRLTDQLDGPFVYGPGKAEAIRQLASERAYDLSQCYAYTDSISDLPMLSAVGHPVTVNPDGELERIAHERGWPVVVFARQAKRAAAAGSALGGTLLVALASYFLGRRHGRRPR